jgi:hypothetical protein
MPDSIHLTPYLDGAFAQVCGWPSVGGSRTVVAIARSAEDATLGVLHRPDSLVGFLLLPAEMGELGSHGRELLATVLARGGTMILVCVSPASAALHLVWLKWCGVTVQHLAPTSPEFQHA